MRLGCRAGIIIKIEIEEKKMANFSCSFLYQFQHLQCVAQSLQSSRWHIGIGMFVEEDNDDGKA